MNTFFKTDVFGYGVVVVCIAVFGALAAFVVYILLLRSVGAVLITRLNIHRRRRHLVVRVVNSIIALICVGLYWILTLPMIKVQLANMSPSPNKTEVDSIKCSKSDLVPQKCQNDRLKKVQLLRDLSSADLSTRCDALVTACCFIYGFDHESLDLDRDILTILIQLTKSDDVLERYLAERAWDYRCHE